MEKINILGVKVNNITYDQTLGQIQLWLKSNNKHYIVTPNPEMIVAAQNDPSFMEILNNADLAIPDSFRLGWADLVIREKNIFKKLLLWPFFLFPIFVGNRFPVVTGTDLVKALCQLACKKGYSLGFLGGKAGIAKKCVNKLKRQFSGLKVAFSDSGGEIDQDGVSQDHSSLITHHSSRIDILFVAFGHIKQEKWIDRYINQVNAKVFIGVGGAFDFLSGSIERSPRWMRNLGLEWLFRLAVQPWRIIRFKSLVEYVFLVLTNSK